METEIEFGFCFEAFAGLNVNFYGVARAARNSILVARNFNSIVSQFMNAFDVKIFNKSIL